MTSSPQIYILLPVHNRCKITSDFIKCLKKQTYRNYHLVLIDDGSTDRTSETVLDLLPDATIIRGKGNWWWGGSLQQGHNWLVQERVPAEDYVLVMNDDTEFEADFLETGLSIMKDHRRTLLTATGYNLTTGQPQDPGGYKFAWKDLVCYETHDVSETNCLSTRGMLATVGDFLSVGGFYPRLIPHYLSDLEFTMRAQERGLKLMLHSDFKIGIDFDKTGNRDLSNETYIQYLLKNFSRRAAMNPIAWTNFIILRCPKEIKVKTLFKFWTLVLNRLFFVRSISLIGHRFIVQSISSIKIIVSFVIRQGVRLIPFGMQQRMKKVVPAAIKRRLRKYHDNVH